MIVGGVGLNAGLRRPDPRTVFLARGDGTGVAFYDTVSGKLKTAGDATIDQVAPGRFIGKAMYFPLATNAQWTEAQTGKDYYMGATGNFTIDVWVKFPALHTDETTQYIISQDATNSDRWVLRFKKITGGGYTITFMSNTTGGGTLTVTTSTQTTILTDTWYHWAICRDGSNWYFFQDGVQIGTTRTSSMAIPDPNSYLAIARLRTDASKQYNGYMDELRYTIGWARWTANFTPPTRRGW